jgi:hypothetical protein
MLAVQAESFARTASANHQVNRRHLRIKKNLRKRRKAPVRKDTRKSGFDSYGCGRTGTLGWKKDG